MEELLKVLQATALEEYERAAAVNGRVFASRHEAYAVILEELEEAGKAGDECRQLLSQYWYDVKNRGGKKVGAELKLEERVFEKAIEAAAEWLQVAGCAHKSLMPITAERKAG